jgi:hypothetical protein
MNIVTESSKALAEEIEKILVSNATKMRAFQFLLSGNLDGIRSSKGGKSD